MKRFIYTKRDRKSVLAIVCLIMAIGLIISLGSKSAVSPSIDFEDFKRKVDSMEQNNMAEPQDFNYSKVQKSDDAIKRKVASHQNKRGIHKRFPSIDTLATRKDPNAKNINYQKSDRKVFYTPRNRAKRSIQKLDVNQSDILDWEELPGIGPYYAKRITNFRDKLGGFSSIEQIRETWYLPDSTFLLIEPHLIYSPIFKKIDINSADEETLKGHPYINWKEARLIVRYRQENGLFHEVGELKKIKAFSKEWLGRILPYVMVNKSEPSVAVGQ